MKAITKLVRRLGVLALMASFGATLNSCSRAQSQPQEIKIDGSSTVFPITDAIAKAFKATESNVEIKVNFSGTSGEFAKFCAGEMEKLSLI